MKIVAGGGAHCVRSGVGQGQQGFGLAPEQGLPTAAGKRGGAGRRAQGEGRRAKGGAGVQKKTVPLHPSMTSSLFMLPTERSAGAWEKVSGSLRNPLGALEEWAWRAHLT